MTYNRFIEAVNDASSMDFISFSARNSNIPEEAYKILRDVKCCPTAAIKALGHTQQGVCDMLGIYRRTLQTWLYSGEFDYRLGLVMFALFSMREEA